jgi:alkylation response protein AidB-like acyl-CoA dehydrogenase
MATRLATFDSVSPTISDDYLSWLTRELASHAEACDRSGEFPRAPFDLLAREGLIGLTVPRELGGRGANLAEALRVLGAVAKGEPSTALILFMTYHYHANPHRAQGWPAAIYERLAKDAVAGRGLIGGLRVEPELGTPVRGGLPATTARRTAEGWIISGKKIYSTGSTGLDWYSVWAKTDEAEPRVGNFLVKAAAPASLSSRHGIIWGCARRSAMPSTSPTRQRRSTMR